MSPEMTMVPGELNLKCSGLIASKTLNLLLTMSQGVDMENMVYNIDSLLQSINYRL